MSAASERDWVGIDSNNFSAKSSNFVFLGLPADREEDDVEDDDDEEVEEEEVEDEEDEEEDLRDESELSDEESEFSALTKSMDLTFLLCETFFLFRRAFNILFGFSPFSSSSSASSSRPLDIVRRFPFSFDILSLSVTLLVNFK